MPVEIGKMVVAAIIMQTEEEATSVENAPGPATSLCEKLKQQLIEESVQQVMAILDRKMNR